MKKNRMMRLASTLLVAVLITTTTISGTFAKYTTSGTATDTARVAKFGVKVTATGDGAMFSKSYEEGNVTVLSDEKVVAPGTKNENAAKFEITGEPEVDVSIKYTATLDLGDKWEVDADGDPSTPATEEYCPIVFTINGETYATKTVDDDLGPGIINHVFNSVDELEAGVAGAITALNVDRVDVTDPATDLSTLGKDLSVKWEWPFDIDDTKDTALGDAAALDEANAGKVTLTVGCRVDQLD